MQPDAVEPENPYRSPRSQVEPLASPPDALRAASRTQRLMTFALDYAMTYGLSFGVGALVSLVFEPSEAAAAWWGLAAGLATTYGYYFALEASTRRTLGKFAVGTRVAREDGTAPSVAQIAGRSLARLIPFEPFSIFRASARCWHDTLSGTVVVRTR